MEVVVKLRVKEESVPEGKDIHSYIREELGWLAVEGAHAVHLGRVEIDAVAFVENDGVSADEEL